MDVCVVCMPDAYFMLPGMADCYIDLVGSCLSDPSKW